VGVVGNRRRFAADDINQLSNLMLANSDDVSIEFIGIAAAGDQCNQRAPTRDDVGRDARGTRIVAEAAPFLLQCFHDAEQADFFARLLFDGAGGVTGQRSLFGGQGCSQRTRKLDLAIQ
jgi:hypothetical protein